MSESYTYIHAHIRENDRILTDNEIVCIKQTHSVKKRKKNGSITKKWKKHCAERKWAKNSEMNRNKCAPKSVSDRRKKQMQTKESDKK